MSSCDEARDNFSSPIPVQYRSATCPFPLILLLSAFQVNQPIPYTHFQALSIITVKIFFLILRDSNLTLFSSLDRSHSHLPPIEEDEGFFSFLSLFSSKFASSLSRSYLFLLSRIATVAHCEFE